MTTLVSLGWWLLPLSLQPPPFHRLNPSSGNLLLSSSEPGVWGSCLRYFCQKRVGKVPASPWESGSRHPGARGSCAPASASPATLSVCISANRLQTERAGRGANAIGALPGAQATLPGRPPPGAARASQPASCLPPRARSAPRAPPECHAAEPSPGRSPGSPCCPPRECALRGTGKCADRLRGT